MTENCGGGAQWGRTQFSMQTLKIALILFYIIQVKKPVTDLKNQNYIVFKRMKAILEKCKD